MIKVAMLRAKMVTDFYNIDLTKDFFSLSYGQRLVLEEVRKTFKFSGKNNHGRSPLRQFYYYLQKGFKELPF